MTFAPQWSRPVTITRKPGRSAGTPRIADTDVQDVQASQTLSLPAPTAGLVMSDSIRNLPDSAASYLRNWVCEPNLVRPRGGSTVRNQGFPGRVRAFANYSSGAVEQMFIVAGSAGDTHSLYDVTDADTTNVAVLSGLPDAPYTSIQFTSSGGQFLVLCADGMGRQLYDGTSWTSPAITGSGLTSTRLSHVWQHGARQFFVEAGTTNAWYLAVDAISGAATKFPLGGMFRLGGTLVAGATWTVDGGESALQSSCVFISSEGEIAIYSGDNPATWSLRGVYHVAKPCGQNCFMKFGGDVAVMTVDGLFALSQATELDRAALASASISKAILPLWRSLVGYGNSSEWTIARRDAKGYVMVNVPAGGGNAAMQLGINMQTGAWFPLSGWDAATINVFGDELLYGSTDGKVMRADVGGSDNGNTYSCVYIGPFREFGGIVSPTLMRAVIRSNDLSEPRVAAIMDYSDDVPSAPQASLPSNVAKWDAGLWDSSLWGGTTTLKSWQSVYGEGTAVAPAVLYTFGQSEMPRADLLATDMLLNVGAIQI